MQMNAQVPEPIVVSLLSILCFVNPEFLSDVVLADRTAARSAIGYWQDTVSCLSVRL